MNGSSRDKFARPTWSFGVVASYWLEYLAWLESPDHFITIQSHRILSL